MLSCKEAAYKAGAGPAPHALSLVMEGTLASGWAVTAAGRPESVVARWEVTADSILSLAVLDSPEKAREILTGSRQGSLEALTPPAAVDSKRAIGNSDACLRHPSRPTPGARRSNVVRQLAVP